jgi:3-isopropylmalate/(R)-2-methylmalate dehydratase small subunit
MDPIRRFASRTVVLPYDDIDTDQIIPARFLTTTTKVGLGENLFRDWRYDASGAPRADFPLNAPEADGAAVLVAGNNFGCGSSREHAPWALLDFGIRAVVSTEIADIFRNNALKNGLVPVIVDAETHAWLIAHPGAEVAVDLERMTLEMPGGRRVRFPIDRFSRYCLMNGLDQLGFLLEQEEAIRRYEESAPWLTE